MLLDEKCYLAVWVCTAALAILDRLDVVDVPTLGWWLAERQLPNGGMNGRPEKLEDVHIPLYFSTAPAPWRASLLSLFPRALTSPLTRNTGLLQPLGPLLDGHPEQAHLDRQFRAHALHPLSPGAQTDSTVLFVSVCICLGND